MSSKKKKNDLRKPCWWLLLNELLDTIPVRKLILSKYIFLCVCNLFLNNSYRKKRKDSSYKKHKNLQFNQ